jgi:penicillin-binding protein 2
MKPLNKTDRAKLRIRMMLGFFLCIQGGILVFLWNIQVVQGHTFRDDISEQSLRRIRHPGARGRIIDRKGIVLADNRPSVGIALYMEELRVPGPSSRTVDRIEEILDDMEIKLELPRTLSRAKIQEHYTRERLLPLVAWDDLTDAQIARWAERIGPQKGVDLLTETVRTYPRNDLLAQTIGYVGRGGATRNQEETSYDFYLDEMEGKAGLEKVYDSILRGEAGGELIRIDVGMYKHNVEASKPSIPGKDIQLTIDARVQWLCERILADQTGSIVVLDPRSGELLALATNPRYDLNELSPRISQRVWDKLTQNPRRPLVNRPVREHYPPGSIIKPFVCLAAEVYSGVDPNTVFNCDGRYFPAPGARPMHCHNRFGHGPLNMRQALERSCNDYMWQLVEQTGYAPILRIFTELGLGKETGLEVDYEVPGILPTDAWKKKRYNDVLRTGDIANISIGQGFLNVTAVQMAQLTATLANGGKKVPLTLIKGFRGPEEQDYTLSDPRKPAVDMGWKPEAVNAIREGMRDVIMSPRGTAHRTAAIDGLTYAGKTGTAQFGPEGNRRYRSWMIAFAPYDNPRIAAVVLIDNGQGSGIDAAPRIKLLMQALFGRAAE